MSDLAIRPFYNGWQIYNAAIVDVVRDMSDEHIQLPPPTTKVRESTPATVLILDRHLLSTKGQSVRPGTGATDIECGTIRADSTAQIVKNVVLVAHN